MAPKEIISMHHKRDLRIIVLVQGYCKITRPSKYYLKIKIYDAVFTVVIYIICIHYIHSYDSLKSLEL